LFNTYTENDVFGEKLLASSLTYEGTVFFSTYIPGEVDICSPEEGTSRTYAIGLEDGSAAYNFTDSVDGRSTPSGIGIPSDPVVVGLDGNIYISPGNLAPLDDFRKNIDVNKLKRTYWYEVGS